jgi:nucleoside-triphosphatase THEP1
MSATLYSDYFGNNGAMLKATSIFTPADVPTLTYVSRSGKTYESDLRRALEVPKMIVSISGPSKSGKTTLVQKIISQDNLIQVYGASIQRPEDLWINVLAWMGGTTELSETTGSRIGGTLTATGGGKLGIPFVAEGSATAQASGGYDRTSTTTEKRAISLIDQVVKDIAISDYVVFVDDFHYIEKSVRNEIGKQIKEAAERGVKICTASVPHRADDVVRSNTELRGRVAAIDMEYWEVTELEQIAFKGFSELNVDLSPKVLTDFATEAFGSPQLMQAICLNFCFQFDVEKRLPEQQRIEVSDLETAKILERTSTMTDFSTMLSVLQAGPKQRGTERKQYSFTDGSKGDVYRCLLLALKADPPQLSFRYDELLRRSTATCKDESPVGSSVAESLLQMSKLARSVQSAPVIEWDEDVLDIVEPYFLFFLRCSPFLNKFN